MLSEKEKERLIEYCWEIGLFITSPYEWSDNKKISKIEKYKRQGFRVMKQNNEYIIINIFDRKSTQRRISTFKNLIQWLLK